MTAMTMKYKLEIQDTINKNTPNRFHIQRWINETLEPQVECGHLCIRIVSMEEMQELNHEYRRQNKPTNVLSFPSDLPPEVQAELNELGDIVICAEVIEREAKEQEKRLEAHWAHMVIHGALHLLGYDHITDKDAATMEKLEIELLNKLGFDNPYERNP